ncbi:MAG: NUDIX domain-containing protein [Pseudomonadota bacterium]
MIAKACAVVLHPDGAPTRTLYFQHPLAGAQLVKGGIEPGEAPLNAAARELWEETSLRARSGLPLTESDSIVPGEHWHFALLRIRGPVADAWSHHTADGGGLTFRCLWHPIDTPHPFEGRFARAWDLILSALKATR